MPEKSQAVSKIKLYTFIIFYQVLFDNEAVRAGDGGLRKMSPGASLFSLQLHFYLLLSRENGKSKLLQNSWYHEPAEMEYIALQS